MNGLRCGASLRCLISFYNEAGKSCLLSRLLLRCWLESRGEAFLTAADGEVNLLWVAGYCGWGFLGGESGIRSCNSDAGMRCQHALLAGKKGVARYGQRDVGTSI